MRPVCTAAFVCLSLNLIGCGGGGSSSSATPPAPPASDSAASTPPSAPAEHWGLSRPPQLVLGGPTDVDAILDHLFSDAATQSALVSKDGYVVGERYADGFDADSLGTSWSVAKSFSAPPWVWRLRRTLCFGNQRPARY